MPQFDIAVRFGPPQIEIPVTEPGFFRCGHFVFNLKRRRLRIVQNVQSRGHHFHFARRDLRVCLLPLDDFPFHRNHILRPQLLRFLVRLGMQFGVKHNLRNPRAVAQVDKNQLAQVPSPVHPAHQHHVFIRVRGPQISRVIRAFQISQCIEQNSRPFRLRGFRIRNGAGRRLTAGAAPLRFQIF